MGWIERYLHKNFMRTERNTEQISVLTARLNALTDRVVTVMSLVMEGDLTLGERLDALEQRHEGLVLTVSGLTKHILELEQMVAEIRNPRG